MTEDKFFPGQGSDEKIFLFVRRHWISFIPTVILCLAMAVLPFVIWLIISSVVPSLHSSALRDYFILGSSAYLLFVSALFIIGWLDYYYDVLMITDERLVHVDQKGLFNRQISELNLLRVQNVSTRVKGILPTFFNFGKLIVETAAAGELERHDDEHMGDFCIESVPDPNKLSATILELHDRLVHERQQEGPLASGEGEIIPHNNHPQPPHSSTPSEQPTSSDTPEHADTSTLSSLDTEDTQTITSNGSTLHSMSDEGTLKEGEMIDL